MKKIDKKIKKYHLILNKSKIHEKNNNNWMNIVRLAINIAPEKVIKIMKKINKNDNRISSLFKKMN